MKKLAVSEVIIGIFVFYSLIHGRANPGSSTALLPRSSTGSSATPTTTDTGSALGATQDKPAGALYRDGSYTGNLADAQWGYVKVKAVIQGGKIADVQWLQYPSDRERSVEINSYADPQLTSEA